MDKINTSSGPTALFVSHGGGPLPLLGDDGHREMVDVLKEIAGVIPKPEAIVVVSAHWEERHPVITHASRPALIYDYYGFPEESYEIQYPATGNPQLAEQVFSRLNSKGFDATLDDQRGFDHGLFVPLKIMYPDADIPCIQVSLLNSLNPQIHIRMGEALGQLAGTEALIIGSGFSFHNMAAFFKSADKESKLKNEAFENWLISTCSNKAIDETERAEWLVNWDQAPFARYCHPREEHLLPLHVCYGVAQQPCRRVFEFNVLNKKASAYLW